MLFGNPQHILHDQQIIRIVPPSTDGSSVSLQGAVKQVSTSFLDILFPPESIPVDGLNRQGEWLIFWEKGENILSARARLDGLQGENRIRLEITGLFFQQSERRYPRVDAEVYLRYWATGNEEKERLAIRQKVSISGCGLLFQSAEAYAVGAQIGLEISLPGPTLEVVRCVGCVVWSRPSAARCHEIALDFVQVPQPELDKILNFCMLEQFKQLHSKVRVMGPVLSPSLQRLTENRPQEE